MIDHDPQKELFYVGPNELGWFESWCSIESGKVKLEVSNYDLPHLLGPLSPKNSFCPNGACLNGKTDQ